MSSIYQIGYLASISRLPDHFYSMVHCLEGREKIFSNPGTALRSFVVREFQNELVVINDELQEVINECEAFSSSLVVIGVIVDLLIAQATEMILKAKDDTEFVTQLHGTCKVVRSQFESIRLQAADNSAGDMFTHDNLVGQNFKQSLIDMKTMLESRI